MPKHIVLLSDGTGNSSGKLFRTNVWRLYQALDLKPASSPGIPEQIAFYDDGVGTSSFKPLAIIGGAFGWGLKRNVLDIYTFLCANYSLGDRIYAFGFSRGAFTIRVLTGLVDSQGLVSAPSKSELRRLAADAFRAYRSERYKAAVPIDRVVRSVRRAFVGRKSAAENAKADTQTNFAFLGLWDTVAAYGLPIKELTIVWDAFFRLAIPNHNPSRIVERGCHALALDDERHTFHPELWNEDGLENHNSSASRIQDERISQVWFTGMHSNVGGGYPDDALSYVPLDWMMEQASLAGLRFKPGAREDVKASADACGKLYDSRQGLGGTYRYLPRKIADLTHDVLSRKDPVAIQRPKIHESALDRIKRCPDGYAPIGLPRTYAVVTTDGRIVDLPAVANSPAILENASQAEDRSHRQEKVWDLVWWRRVIYFASIAVAFALGLFPLYRAQTEALESPLAGLSWLVHLIGFVLPAAAAPWLRAYESHPATFGALAAALGACLFAGGHLQTRISDSMRALWRPIFGTPGAIVRPSHLPTNTLYRLRTHPAYKKTFRILTHFVLPGVAGAVAFFVTFAGMNRSVFAVADSLGLVCRPAGGGSRSNIFPTDSVCWSTGVNVEHGQRYQVAITIDDSAPWIDCDIPSGVGGFAMKPTSFLLHAAVLFRRQIAEPWFKPIARIGTRGSDEYPLEPIDGPEPNDTTKTLVAEITARRDGELFLFVNDVVLAVPNSWQWFYANHHGKAVVSVCPIKESALACVDSP